MHIQYVLQEAIKFLSTESFLGLNQTLSPGNYVTNRVLNGSRIHFVFISGDLLCFHENLLAILKKTS